MNRTPKQNLKPVYYAIILLVGLFLGYNLNNKVNGSGFLNNSNNNTLQEISNLIKNKYVDDINVDSINTATADVLLSQLDPHSIYIPPIDLEATNSQLEGKFSGIGIMYEIIDDTINVTETLNKSAARQAGIEVGDKIIAIDDTIKFTKANLDIEHIRNAMRGKEGSAVSLTILRENAIRKIALKRSIVNVSSIDVAYMLDAVTGYIKINKFAERTYEEFMEKLEKLQKQKMQNLVIDLRGNGGGFMHAATAIADEFLDNDKLIVYTQGKKSAKDEHHCKKEGLFETGKLFVLIDETSASASEVLAGALQDWDRATIIGRRSFGKGLVQQQYNLSNGGALRLTTARYYSPLGRNIQKSYKEGVDKYHDEVENRYTDGDVFNADTVIKNGKQYKTPKGKIVYGGGGVTPDVVVTLDTTNNLKQFYRVANSNAFHRFQLDYYKQNKQQISGLKTADDFTKTIAIAATQQNQLQSSLTKDKLNNTIKISPENVSKLQQKLQANMAKHILGTDAFFIINNKYDNTINKALELSKP